MAKLIADQEMVVLGKIFDLLATLKPTRRRAVHDYIGQRLDEMPVIAEVVEPVPVPMFPDADTRRQAREAS
jgi:hypothetical protein